MLLLSCVSGCESAGVVAVLSTASRGKRYAQAVFRRRVGKSRSLRGRPNLRGQPMPSPSPWKMIRSFHLTVRNPNSLIPPATYGVVSGTP